MKTKNAILKAIYKYGDETRRGMKVGYVAFYTEIEVTADTDEDSLMDILDFIRETYVELYGTDEEGDDRTLAFDWNSDQIFGIADRLVEI